MALAPTTTIIDIDDTPLTILRGGTGRPLLMLHDELGFPGWLRWNDRLADNHEMIIPLQPGYGRTPRLAWFRDYRDLAIFYGRLVRQLDVGAIDVIGFSAGAYVAAEMAVMNPAIFNRMALVAPLGVRPLVGEIFDFLATTMQTHVAVSVSRHEAPEFATMYSGGITPEQFELFEAARGETSRLGWEPFMHDPTLPHHLHGIGGLPTLIVWGEEDLIVPRGAIDAYQGALPDADVRILPGVGHRPELEDVDGFVDCVSKFFSS